MVQVMKTVIETKFISETKGNQQCSTSKKIFLILLTRKWQIIRRGNTPDLFYDSKYLLFICNYAESYLKKITGYSITAILIKLKIILWCFKKVKWALEMQIKFKKKEARCVPVFLEAGLLKTFFFFFWNLFSYIGDWG